MTRFLGDSPIRVLVKLVLLSLLVGWVLQWLAVTPLDVVDHLVAAARNVWALGIDGLSRFGGTIALGAVFVVPLFLVSRIVNRRRTL